MALTTIVTQGCNNGVRLLWRQWEPLSVEQCPSKANRQKLNKFNRSLSTMQGWQSNEKVALAEVKQEKKLDYAHNQIVLLVRKEQ
jgi:hypothetical protein